MASCLSINMRVNLGMVPLALDCIRSALVAEAEWEQRMHLMALDALGEIQAAARLARIELGIYDPIWLMEVDMPAAASVSWPYRSQPCGWKPEAD